jgi:hypothetical protein
MTNTNGVIMARLMLMGLALLLLPACSSKEPDMKSPCVGADNSPCARRPVNDRLG